MAAMLYCNEVGKAKRKDIVAYVEQSLCTNNLT